MCSNLSPNPGPFRSWGDFGIAALLTSNWVTEPCPWEGSQNWNAFMAANYFAVKCKTKIRKSGLLRGNFNKFSQQLHPLADVLRETHLSDDPVLHLIESPQKQVEVCGDPAEFLTTKHVVYYLILSKRNQPTLRNNQDTILEFIRRGQVTHAIHRKTLPFWPTFTFSQNARDLSPGSNPADSRFFFLSAPHERNYLV